MIAWLPILDYREFHDVPRLLLVASEDRFLLLDCPFDDGSDDYMPDYHVYELESDPRPYLGADWRGLPETGTLLGRVPVISIAFDASRRQAIKSAGLATFLK